jgi:hypothetical protein
MKQSSSKPRMKSVQRKLPSTFWKTNSPKFNLEMEVVLRPRGLLDQRQVGRGILEIYLEGIPIIP